MLGSVHCDAKISVLFSYSLHSWKGMLSKETKLRISKALGQGPKPVSDMVGLCPILNYSLTRLSNLVWPWWLLATLPCESSTLAWKIPRMEEPGRLQSMRSWRVGRNWATSLSLFTFMHWRRKWQPTPVFLPGESQGRRSLVGCRLWSHTESDTTEAT